jgi:hypothetical protein
MEIRDAMQKIAVEFRAYRYRRMTADELALLRESLAAPFYF